MKKQTRFTAGGVMRRRTNFAAGGLEAKWPTRIDLSSINGQVPLPRLDARPYCADIANQGYTSSCAGQTVAAWCQVQHYRRTCIPKKYNGFEIYDEAKGPNGDNNKKDGTSLGAAFAAAIRLGCVQDACGTDRVTATEISSLIDVKVEMCKNLVCITGDMITDGWNRADARTGFIAKSDNVIGGHATLRAYYDTNSWGFENSWDKTWGYRGFGRMTNAQAEAQFMYGLAVQIGGVA